MKIKLLFLILTALSFSIIVSAQNAVSDENSVDALPEQVMQEVVSRILVYKFKSSSVKKFVTF